MKKQILFVVLSLYFRLGALNSHAQKVDIDISITQPGVSTMLDVSSTNQGILIPRVNDAQQAVIPSPSPGLLSYNATTDKFDYNKNTRISAIKSRYILPGSCSSSQTELIDHKSGIAVNGIGKPITQIDLWVMSQCPYGIQAENILYQVIAPDTAKQHLSVRVHYILEFNSENKTFTSLHGENERKEDMRQMIIGKYFSDKFWSYIISRNSHYYDTLWTKDARICGLDPVKINELMVAEGTQLVIADAKMCDSLHINSSPTLFINGVRIRWSNDFPSLFMMLYGKEIASAPGSRFPECFDDADCIPETSRHIAHCLASKCISKKAPDVHLTVILPDTTFGNHSKSMLNMFNTMFPGLFVKYMDYKTKSGNDLIKFYNIGKLPAYIFDEDIQNDENFDNVRLNLLKIDNAKKISYLVKPTSVPASYYITRPEHKDEINIFLMSDCPFSKALEDSIYVHKSIKNITVNYIVKKDSSTGEFSTIHGIPELKENKRQIVIQKYFPSSFWDYVNCRNKTNNVESCLNSAGINRDSVNKLIIQTADSLLTQDAVLSDSLNIINSPTLLWQNRQILIGSDNIEKLLGIKPVKGSCESN